MIINKCLGVPKKEIEDGKHNVWIGVSLGNKWFTKENLKKLIDFSLLYTKESLFICVPGRLHATNLRYFDNLSRADSLKKAFELGDNKLLEVQDIVSNLDDKDKSKIILGNYDDVLTPKFVKQREVLMREFAEKGEFYNSVIEISNEMIESRGRTQSNERSESVSLYILQELPLFLDGVVKIGTEIVYTAIFYPGLGKLDYLVADILNNNSFKNLREKLNISYHTGIVSVEV